MIRFLIQKVPILDCNSILTLVLLLGCAKDGQVSSVSPVAPPEENRFVKTTLAEGLREPMELAVDGEGNVFWVERKGSLYYYNHKTKKSQHIKEFEVFSGNNDGLLGITLDPDFKNNHFLYIYYSPAGEVPKQHLSRSIFDVKSYSISSEKVILEVPTQRDFCCHSGGSLTFGPDRNLYIAVGDNVSPKVQDGYSPLDEREGRKPFDAQGTSANSNDLRGKVLRIHINEDGSYTIPDGNLFPKDGSKGKPEIFVMGVRNPFRISVNPKTGYLYFGDIGPDANISSIRGPAAHDEVNVAKKAGFFGWPYFVGNNKAFPKYNFATHEIGKVQNPESPINNSPHNTGIKRLPSVQTPMIWYSYEQSDMFPSLGTGGRSIMGGPVYRFNHSLESKVKFPKYFDNTLFIYDWMRDWIKAVKLDENGDMKFIQDFMPNSTFASPIDMEFGADGSLYMLEYGKGWYNDNPDSKLVRITHEAGNRAPMAKVELSTNDGTNPLKVKFSGSRSTDPDGDLLNYEWSFYNNNVINSREASPEFTYNKVGVHKARLTVKDNDGKASTTYAEVIAGNTKPEIQINIDGNSSFYWSGTKLKYQINVTDVEDGSLADKTIPAQRVKIKFASTTGKNLSPLITDHVRNSEDESDNKHPGKLLIDQSDCKSCHAVDKNSIGPSYREVAARYKSDKTAIEKLAVKIVKGGSGNWNKNFVMIAHPSISQKASEEMVKYILSLAEDKSIEDKVLQVSGELEFAKEDSSRFNNFYHLKASYEDKGGLAEKPIKVEKVITFRPAVVQAESCVGLNKCKIIGKIEDGNQRFIGSVESKGYIYFKDVDLREIEAIKVRYSSTSDESFIEVRLDSPVGSLIGEKKLISTKGDKNWQSESIKIKLTNASHDLYFVFSNPIIDKSIVNVDTFHFLKKY